MKNYFLKKKSFIIYSFLKKNNFIDSGYFFYSNSQNYLRWYFFINKFNLHFYNKFFIKFFFNIYNIKHKYFKIFYYYNLILYKIYKLYIYNKKNLFVINKKLNKKKVLNILTQKKIFFIKTNIIKLNRIKTTSFFLKLRHYFSSFIGLRNYFYKQCYFFSKKLFNSSLNFNNFKINYITNKNKYDVKRVKLDSWVYEDIVSKFNLRQKRMRLRYRRILIYLFKQLYNNLTFLDSEKKKKIYLLYFKKKLNNKKKYANKIKKLIFRLSKFFNKINYKKGFFIKLIQNRLKKYHFQFIKVINYIKYLNGNKKFLFFFKKNNYSISSVFKKKNRMMSLFLNKNKNKYINFPISKKIFYNQKLDIYWLDLYYYKFFYKKRKHFLSLNFKKKMYLFLKNKFNKPLIFYKYNKKLHLNEYNKHIKKKKRMFQTLFSSFLYSKFFSNALLNKLGNKSNIKYKTHQYNKISWYKKKYFSVYLLNKKIKYKSIFFYNKLLSNNSRFFKKSYLQLYKKKIKSISYLKKNNNTNIKYVSFVKNINSKFNLTYLKQDKNKLKNENFFFYSKNNSFKKNKKKKYIFSFNNIKKNYSMLISRKKRRKIINSIKKKNRNIKLLNMIDKYNNTKFDSKFIKRRYVYNKNSFLKIDFFSKYKNVFYSSNLKKKHVKNTIFFKNQSFKKKYLNLIMDTNKENHLFYSNDKFKHFKNKKSLGAWKKFFNSKNKRVSTNMNDKDYIYLNKDNLFFLFKNYFIYYFIYSDFFFFPRYYSYYLLYFNKNVLKKYIIYIKSLLFLSKNNLIKKKKNKLFFYLFKKIIFYFFNKYSNLFKKIKYYFFKLHSFFSFLNKNNNKILLFLFFYKIFSKYIPLNKFFIKNQFEKANKNKITIILFKKEKIKKNLSFFIEYILSIFYLFHKLKKNTYINNLFFFYLNKKKINKINLLKKNIRYRLRRKKWSFHFFFDNKNVINMISQDFFQIKYLIPFFIINNNNLEKQISTSFHKNIFLYNLNNNYFSFSKIVKLNSYSSKSFIMWNWVWKNKIQIILKTIIFIIKSFLYLSIKKSFLKNSLNSFLLIYNKILINLLNNIIINKFQKNINNVFFYYILYAKKIYNINFFYDVILRFLLQNKSFYLYYMKYYILNFLYLFYYIEVTISKYINNNCFLFINYSLRWKYYLNSAKMWCEYIAYFLKKKLTIWKLFFFIKKQQKIEKNRCTYEILAKKNNNVFLQPFRYPLKGIRILYSGNFKKAKRKRKLYYYVWLSNSKYTEKMPLKQFKFYIDYYSTSVSLKRSNVGIKFWLLFNIF